MTVMTDVLNPLCGPTGASAVYVSVVDGEVAERQLSSRYLGGAVPAPTALAA